MRSSYCLVTLCLLCILAQARSAHRQALQIQPAPAPAPALPVNGVVGAYEPKTPGFYLAQQQAVKSGLQLNQTFYDSINKTDVPAIQRVTNGTFVIKPVVQAGGGKIESANSDGAPVTLATSRWARRETQQSAVCSMNTHSAAVYCIYLQSFAFVLCTFLSSGGRW